MTGKVDPVTLTVREMALFFSETFKIPLEQAMWLIQPPREEYGDLSFPLMRYLRGSGYGEREIVETLRGRLWEKGIYYISLSVDRGYLNLRFEESELSRHVFTLVRSGWRPETVKADAPETIVVEHTSANPIHPLHIGHARNTSIGDTLARLFKARGHRVNTRFYIDDVGRQTAIAALGFQILGVDPGSEAKRLGVKPDHLVGWVYAATHTILDILEAKKRLEKADAGERERIQRKIDSLMSTLSRLKDSDPGGYMGKLLDYSSKNDLEDRVQEIMRRYEKGLDPEKSLIRSVVAAVLEGFRETLARIGAEFDSWDWESDIVWSSRVEKLLEKARGSKYYVIHKGAEALNIPAIIEELVKPRPELHGSFKTPKGFEIPPLILVRSDGTTLYTTRDIAYSIYKFEQARADRVVNVIGADQRLSQLQVKLALLGLGYEREARNMIHYDYEIVRLPGRSMSGRRGEYVSLDQLLDEVKSRALSEVEKRNPDMPREWIEDVAEKVTAGATRFALVQVSSKKPITFDLERVLDFKENSGPYLQYTHARASRILEKHGPIDYGSIDYTASYHPERRRLLLLALRYPLVSAKAADDMAPEDLVAYLVKLADIFNSWYPKDSVIHDPDPGARNYKAALVNLVKEVLSEGMKLIGVPPLERM
ncbi:MAG: arginine--tRNA ligase [Desulfurococcales archaeon]|nr:arginine--tRNA ligase [Desulfurococcales archaeon]